MNSQPAYNTHTHVVDILGNVKGRDQPIMLMSKAIELVTTLDAEVFLDDDVVFFDPFCKAGEILLACAFSSCRAKFELVPELFTEEAFKKQVEKELYHSSRYFALAPDERHHRLSLRTFLGNENSHKEHFNHIIRNGNYVSEIDGKLNRDKFEQEFSSMLEHIKSTSGNKKIIAVGNPPYQESDGGAQKSAKPIYQIFVNSLINHCQINEFVLVIPARWFAGGKGLDSFRESTINSKNVKSLKYFAKSGEVFPTVDIDGGICFFHWDEINNSKPEFIVDEKRQKIDLSEYDIIPDDPGAYEILHKIRSKWNGKWVSDVAWSRKPFGLSTDYFKKNNSIDPSKFEDAVMCIGRQDQQIM